MKKSLVALAALAATGAFAQSSVTLYGRIDAGLTNQTTETQAAGSKVTKFDLGGAQNQKTGARIGVTGVEDLGGGLKAGFVIESRVNIDKNVNAPSGGFSQGTFGLTRQANINLNGGFGTVVLGTYYNAFDDLRYAHSPNIGGGSSNGTSAQAGGDAMTLGGIGAVAGATATAISERSENAIGYSTPSFGGFKVRASLLSRKNIADTQNPLGEKINGFGIAAGYDNGPLSVLGVVGVAKRTLVAAGTQVQKVNDFGFNVKYDFGVAVPYLAFEQSKVNGAGSAYLKGRSIEVGAKFPLGAFTPYVTANFNKFSADTAAKGKATAFQIGTNYDISKRTSAYAALGSDKSTDTTGGANNYVKRNGVSLGLVHKF